MFLSHFGEISIGKLFHVQLGSHKEDSVDMNDYSFVLLISAS